MRPKIVMASVTLVGILFVAGVVRAMSPGASANPSGVSEVVLALNYQRSVAQPTRGLQPTVLVVPPIATYDPVYSFPTPTEASITAAEATAAARADLVSGAGAVPAARLPEGTPVAAGHSSTPAPQWTPPGPSDARTINGVPVDKIVLLDDARRQRVREIFAQGQQMGRNARSFSKVGDSTMAFPPLLADYASRGAYSLGQYVALQPAIDHYVGSLARSSAAVKKGMHTWTEFDPAWTGVTDCQPDESPLACEFRLNNPSVVIIRLGANDFFDPGQFNGTMRRILDFWVSRGVVPILGTKPDRQEGEQNTINQVIYEIAADYRIPVWDYDAVAGTLLNRGLEADHTHMAAGHTHDYASALAYAEAEPLEDLTALMALDAVRQTVGQ